MIIHVSGHKAGMLANFVILSGDPVTMPPDEIRNIEVLETIKQGGTRYPTQDGGVNPLASR